MWNLRLKLQLVALSAGTITPVSRPGETISRENTDELNAPPTPANEEALHTWDMVIGASLAPRTAPETTAVQTRIA